MLKNLIFTVWSEHFDESSPHSLIKRLSIIHLKIPPGPSPFAHSQKIIQLRDNFWLWGLRLISKKTDDSYSVWVSTAVIGKLLSRPAII